MKWPCTAWARGLVPRKQFLKNKRKRPQHSSKHAQPFDYKADVRPQTPRSLLKPVLQFNVCDHLHITNTVYRADVFFFLFLCVSLLFIFAVTAFVCVRVCAFFGVAFFCFLLSYVFLFLPLFPFLFMFVFSADYDFVCFCFCLTNFCFWFCFCFCCC